MKIISTFNFKNNITGRVFEENSFKKAFENYIRTHKDAPMLGEIIHSNKKENYMSLQNISHEITNITNDNGIVTIETELLSTPQGKLVENMIKNGSQLTVVPRGFFHNEEILDENGIQTGEYNTIIDAITSWDIQMI